MPVPHLLPMTPDVDDVAVTRQQAKRPFDELLRTEHWAVLLVLTQFLNRLSEATTAGFGAYVEPGSIEDLGSFPPLPRSSDTGGWVRVVLLQPAMEGIALHGFG